MFHGYLVIDAILAAHLDRQILHVFLLNLLRVEEDAGISTKIAQSTREKTITENTSSALKKKNSKKYQTSLKKQLP